MPKKIALALSGGGMHGAFQVGALEFIRANWNLIAAGGGPMKYDVIAGVSAGALNGAMVATGQMDELIRLWDKVGVSVEEVYTSDFIDTKSKEDKIKMKIDRDRLLDRFLGKENPLKWPTRRLLGLVRKDRREEWLGRAGDALKEAFQNFPSIASNKPLADKLHAMLRKADVDTIFRCGYVPLDKGEYQSFRSTEFASDADFANAVLASASLPVVWEPVPLVKTSAALDRSNVDGGLVNSSPLGDVINEIEKDAAFTDEYFILIINCHNGIVEEQVQPKRNIASIAVRSIVDIALSEIFRNDLNEFTRINMILEQVRAIDPNIVIKKENGLPLKLFKFVIIEPKEDDNLGDAMVATTEWINKRKQLGRDRAAEALGGLGGAVVV